MKFFYKFSQTVFFLFIATVLLAQPSNNECNNATALTSLSNWCSDAGQYSNAGATESVQPSPGCFPNNQPNNDVWFSFIAQATDVNISVIGNTNFDSGGTLSNPQFALYEGDCNGLADIACASDATGTNIVQSFAFGLNVGQTYYIRVSARDGNTGTFQLCINNFNEVPSPSGDCNTAVVLCDKSPFTVPNIQGIGSVNDVNGSGCDDGPCVFGENNSTWYKWTCEDPGSLTFTLTPLNPIDDLDFVIYELPGGINDCNNKQELRCMMSGEVVGANFPVWQPCTGPTGTNLGSVDTGESCGCDPGDDNFVAGINMQAGVSYALIVDNFSMSGDGFTIEFGGTGTFLGPTAAYNTSTETVCYGESITFTDASTFVNGDIVSYNWDFGNGAIPATSNQQNPPPVTWNSIGSKVVVLTIESDEGCIVTEVGTIQVDPCCEDVNEITADGLITDLLCASIQEGAIDLTAVSNAPITEIDWSNGASTEDIGDLAAGQYSVTITNEATCEEVLEFEVLSPPPILTEVEVGMPTCGGVADGSILITTSGGVSPYLYDWNDGNGLVPTNTFINIPIGDYDVTIQDANGCLLELTIPVEELVLELEPGIPVVIPPSCTGESDASITINIANGQPPYMYDFNDGNGFVSTNTLGNIPAGTYTVNAIDENTCTGEFEIIVEDPPPLAIQIDTINVSCFGEGDGIAVANVSGGVGNYTYEWSNGGQDSVITELVPGDYFITVFDGNGCEIQSGVTITEPPELFIEDLEVIDVLCFGQLSGQIIVGAAGGTPPYVYSTNGNFFQSDNVLANLPARDYTIYVEDANGCIATATATISSPPPLVIDAGEDAIIDLGFSTDINSTLSPLGWEVTYQWIPEDGLGCIDCADPEAAPVNTTTYQVIVTDNNGCTSTDEVTIVVEKKRPIYIPNAFSPNQDGTNDFFTAYAGPAARQIRTFKVFNRWGGLVFDGRNVPIGQDRLGWDGTFLGERLPPDVFAFFMEVEYIDDEVVLYEGSITLVR